MKNIVENALNANNVLCQILRDDEQQKVFKFGMALNNGRCDCFIDV